MPDLYYLSEPVAEDLKTNIEPNLEYYRGDGFSEKSGEIGWNIRFEGREFDLQHLDALDGQERTAAADMENSKVVWRALSKLTPSEANEAQIWLRLSHVEAFEYTKARWLTLGTTDDKQVSAIKNHFFANGRTGIRDDHSISRLWWNAYIAHLAYPENPDRALELILKTADIRSNIVERPWISIRQPLLHGILAVLDAHEDTMSEARFRMFMKSINKNGAGLIFEAMKPSDVDSFALSCITE